MNDTFAFHTIYTAKAEVKNIQTVLHEGNKSGEGTMRRFDVAPGIQITYNDLKMDSCFRPIRFEKDFLQINHCLEGCYRGITVLLEMEIAQQTLDQGFQQAHISLEQIREQLCTDGRSLIIKSKHEIDHIFSELYSVDERIQVPYFWIKVIELLLFLSLLDGSAVCRPQQFSADISKRTQEVYQYIIENPFTKDTIQDLACMFGLAESSLKRCFKSIAGASIGTFVKTKRMEAAAEMLVSEPTLSIGEIGSVAGYENQSKFSAAFKSVMGVTPQAYRHKYC